MNPSWTVVCDDEVTRHEGTFPTRLAAARWATWGHVCFGAHRFLKSDSFVPPAPTLPSRPQASGGTNCSVSTGRHGRPDTAPPVYKPASVLTVLDDLKGEPRP